MSDDTRPRVVVVGSVNLDVVAELDHLPRPGETMIAQRVRRNLGGKGANQAVGAQITSGAAAFVGRVGSDSAGDELLAELGRRGVSTEHTAVVAYQASGIAYIQVAAGENTIVVAAGANWAWDRLGDAESAAVAAAEVVVAQMEIPDSVIAAAASTATGRFVLNAAPARAVDPTVLSRCDPLVVNENELADLSGMRIDSPESALAAAEVMRDRGARSVVTTLGAAGSVWTDTHGHGVQPAVAVAVVDSTGAGDLFVGTLAARLAAGDDLGRAVAVATGAASFSVTRMGTVDSYPDAGAIDALVENLPAARTTPRTPATSQTSSSITETSCAATD